MARGQDWTELEIEACVADYLLMLTLELNGQRYNKTEHAEALMARLDERSRGSVEFKHCNISAVMLALGYPAIDGYKPRSNYQARLLDVVAAQTEANIILHDAAQAAVSRPAIAMAVPDIAAVWVSRPEVKGVHEPAKAYLPNFTAIRRDYLAQEARNRSLGRAGELFVLELETRRLHAAGKKALSKRVDHVARTQGDGLGYDVFSFDESGRERLIEVKTTAFGQLTPFFVSRNELARSEADSDHYFIYRLFDFRDRPRVFQLPGVITGFCQLDPMTYRASLA